MRRRLSGPGGFQTHSVLRLEGIKLLLLSSAPVLVALSLVELEDPAYAPVLQRGSALPLFLPVPLPIPDKAICSQELIQSLGLSS